MTTPTRPDARTARAGARGSSIPKRPDLPSLRDRVAGIEAEPAQRLGGTIADPNDGTAICPQVATDPALLDRALATARRFHADGTWRRISPVERADVLDAVADALDGRAEAIAVADAATTGAVVSLTRATSALAALVFRGAGQLLRDGVLEQALPGPHGDVSVLSLPLGPVAVIAPWNAPAAIAAHKVASALAAGSPVILKGSEWAPHSCELIADAVLEGGGAAGLPVGAFQLVHGGGSVGGTLVRDERVAAVSFTGGLEAGRAVAVACAEQLKPAQLELGGNNPIVVLDDADVAKAAAGVVEGLVTLNGQWCRALGRLIVHESLVADLMDAVVERLAAVRLGHSLDPASEMGPLVHEGHRDLVERSIASLAGPGRTVLAPTPIPDLPGWFVSPALVLGVDSTDAVDEIFGPVATVHAFAADDEALALANGTPFGLAGYVFGSDEERALQIAREVHAGGVKVNGVGLTSLHPAAPRPAWGLSGLGDEGTLETLSFFTGHRVVGVAASGGAESHREPGGTS